VNCLETAAELEALQKSMQSGTLFGALVLAAEGTHKINPDTFFCLLRRW
jgi:hypothetical protein